MTITTTKTVTEERVIPVPSFWKTAASYYALIDENNVYRVFTMDDLHAITNGTATILEDDLKTYFHKTTELITEEQFFSAYSEAREATNLEPKLKSEDFLSTITSALQLQPKEY
jgi:predicted RNA-binding protein associated with RNAse of E/G family